MLAVLPLVLLVGLFASIHRWPMREAVAPTLRAALLAVVTASMWILVTTEVLSAFRCLTRTWVVAAWTIPVAIVLANLVWTRAAAHSKWLSRLSRSEALMAAACLAMLTLTGSLALLTPPTSHDCLSYHLTRQVFWIQDAAVHHYPSPDMRHNELAPFAEYIGAHLMILSESDHAANMPQWIAYLWCAIGAAACAAELGASSRGRWLAGLLALTLPMAAIQSFNAKNDLVCGMFALTALYATIRIVKGSRSRIDHVVLATSIGLMILTKGTGFLLAAPLVVVTGVIILRRCRWRGLLVGAGMGAMVVSINAGHWVRNYTTSHFVVTRPADQGGFGLSSTMISPSSAVSGVIRNLSLHSGTPWPSVNQWQERVLAAVHRALNIAVDEPATTLHPGLGVHITNRWNADSGASAAVHVTLILAMAFAGPCLFRRFGRAWTVCWAVSLASAILFCVLLKWQPWHGRLHVPFVLMAVPALALWVSRWPAPILRQFVASAAASLAVCAVIWNDTKPLAGPKSVIGRSRSEIRFAVMPMQRKLLTEAAKRVASLNPRVVGLLWPAHSCDYLIMRSILDHSAERPRFVYLRSWLQPTPQPDEPVPDVVCDFNKGTPAYRTHQPSRTRFEVAWAYGSCHVHLPSDHATWREQVHDRPAFVGWETESGLEKAEGPYPKWNLPVVRWAKASQTTLRFDSDGTDSLLVVECRRNDRPDQSMRIALNGSPVSSVEFGPEWEWIPLRITLKPKQGMNVLAFEYANLNEPGVPRAVLFRRLQILPYASVEAALQNPPPSPR